MNTGIKLLFITFHVSKYAIDYKTCVFTKRAQTLPPGGYFPRCKTSKEISHFKLAQIKWQGWVSLLLRQHGFGNCLVCRNGPLFKSGSEVASRFVVVPPCRELITWLNEQALTMSEMSKGAKPAGSERRMTTMSSFKSFLWQWTNANSKKQGRYLHIITYFRTFIIAL